MANTGVKNPFKEFKRARDEKKARSAAVSEISDIIRIFVPTVKRAGLSRFADSLETLDKLLPMIKKSNMHANEVEDLRDCIRQLQEKFVQAGSVDQQLRRTKYIADVLNDSFDRLLQVKEQRSTQLKLKRAKEMEMIESEVRLISQLLSEYLAVMYPMVNTPEKDQLNISISAPSAGEGKTSLQALASGNIITNTNSGDGTMNVIGRDQHNTYNFGISTDASFIYLPHSYAAKWDHKTRDECLEGTRTEFLDRVYKWAANEATLPAGIAGLDIPAPAQILWINGMAGTGKSTIASTIAKYCDKKGMLGASFFCSRDDAKCNDPKLLITSIVYQLCLHHEPLKQMVIVALQKKPDIIYAGVARQIEKLIVEPMSQLPGLFSHHIVIIDALDECKDESSISVVLTALSQHVERLPSLKFIITSRPEKRINEGFNLQRIKQITSSFKLHEIELTVVNEDIQLYLATNCKRIQQFFHCENWPPNTDLDKLVKMSSGLFIFAATSIKFIEDNYAQNPVKQLEVLLNKLGEPQGSLLSGLYKLYKHVLDTAFPLGGKAAAQEVCEIIACIALLQTPLSSTGLSKLCRFSECRVKCLLDMLQSVISMQHTIHFLHPSFYDFLNDQSSGRWMIQQNHHRKMLLHCLYAMHNLKRNICDLPPNKILRQNCEIEELAKLIKEKIPQHIQYACQHWADHLSAVEELSLDVMVELDFFCCSHLLHWVEVCSLVGLQQYALTSLINVQHMLDEKVLRTCKPLTPSPGQMTIPVTSDIDFGLSDFRIRSDQGICTRT